MSLEQINALQDLAGLVIGEIELRQIATTDSLTGALTRRAFEVDVNRELKRTERYGHDLSLITLDIDHFKAVNDCYGHAAGDLVLKTVVAAINQEVRPSDFVGRLGGEEFVIALPETDINGARLVAERIRQKIADTVMQVQSTAIRVTASFGSSSYDRGSIAWTNILERADVALYEAKEGGRNRVVCHKSRPAIRRVA